MADPALTLRKFWNDVEAADPTAVRQGEARLLMEQLATTAVTSTTTTLPAGLSIAGSAFADRNGNGRRDPSESALESAVVKLFRGAKVVRSVVGRSYSFTGLAPGRYVLRTYKRVGKSLRVVATQTFNVG